MKARITIVDDTGQTLEGEVELRPTTNRPVRVRQAVKVSVSTEPTIDFSMQERAFVKMHAAGLSGPKKFILLLAYLSKGRVGEEIALKDLEARWNKMTAPSLLDGKFNRFYSSTARENDWAETKKPGSYSLRPSWTTAIKSSV